MMLPSQICRMDAGAEEFFHKLNGKTVWMVCVSPPSGIERDMLVIVDGDRARELTDAEYQQVQS